MSRSYYRAELYYPLDVDEVVERMIAESEGRMQHFPPGPPKSTNGKPDPPGRHYSTHNYKGRFPSDTTSGLGAEIIIGITDYEFFGKTSSGKKASGRREGHSHFFITGKPKWVALATDQFKLSIPGSLWQDLGFNEKVHDYYYNYYNYYYNNYYNFYYYNYNNYNIYNNNYY